MEPKSVSEAPLEESLKHIQENLKKTWVETWRIKLFWWRVVQNHTFSLSATTEEKTPSETWYWRGFWDQSPSKIKEIRLQRWLKQSVDFMCFFLLIFAEFWTPRWRQNWCQDGAKGAPRWRLNSKIVPIRFQDVFRARFWTILDPPRHWICLILNPPRCRFPCWESF